MKLQQKKLTIGSQSSEEKEAEKLRKLKEKWAIISPLGSELLGQKVSFKSLLDVNIKVSSNEEVEFI